MTSCASTTRTSTVAQLRSEETPSEGEATRRAGPIYDEETGALISHNGELYHDDDDSSVNSAEEDEEMMHSTQSAMQESAQDTLNETAADRRSHTLTHQRDPAVISRRGPAVTRDTIPYKCTILTDTSFFSRKKTFHLMAQEPSTGTNDANEMKERPLMTAEYEAGSLFSRNGQFKVYQTEDDTTVGYVSCPGWFADKSVFFGPNQEVKGSLHFTCTSRNGKLMDMVTALPQVYQLKREQLDNIVTETTNLSEDLAKLLCDFVCPLSYWSEDISDMTIKNCKSYSEENPKKTFVMSNKKPVWNPAISAFTLEFGGRAQVPSVHNFQLASSQESGPVLQLGKVEDGRFNMDFGYPLSTFQAFAICVSVMQRTFVHD